MAFYNDCKKYDWLYLISNVQMPTLKVTGEQNYFINIADRMKICKTRKKCCRDTRKKRHIYTFYTGVNNTFKTYRGRDNISAILPQWTIILFRWRILLEYDIKTKIIEFSFLPLILFIYLCSTTMHTLF